VLWVINRTTSIDVFKVEVDRDHRPDPEKSGYSYPKSINNAPQHASTLAIYNQPSDDFYTVTISYRTATPPNPKYPGPEQDTVSIRKQMPRAADYAIFIYRDKDGNIIIKDEEPGFKPDATDDDDTEPPIPPVTSNNVPLIVRNATASAQIDYVNIWKDNFTMQSAGVKPRNDELNYLVGGTQYKARAYYKVIGTATQQQTSEITVPVIRDTTSQAWHTLYLYFYKKLGGGYEITTQWPDKGPSDSDPTDNVVNPDTDSVLFIFYNKTNSANVMAISIDLWDDPNDEPVIKTFEDFIDRGPIGPSVNKSVKFLTPGDFVINNGAPYNVRLSVDDYRYNIGKHNVIVKRIYNLYRGGAIVIELTDQTVADAVPETPIPPHTDITYTVVANGGPPAGMSDAGYTTTTLTFTFSEPVSINTGNITKVSGDITFGSLTAAPSTVYALAVTPSKSEEITLKVSAAGVETGNKPVVVYKQASQPPQFIPVTNVVLRSLNTGGTYGDYQIIGDNQWHEYEYEIIPNNATNKTPIYWFKGAIAQPTSVALDWTNPNASGKGTLRLKVDRTLYYQKASMWFMSFQQTDQTGLSLMAYIDKGVSNNGSVSVPADITIDEYVLIKNKDTANNVTNYSTYYEWMMVAGLQAAGNGGKIDGKPYSDPRIKLTWK
jgi:hypothetical protein